uniref:Uncharacterized protein n=1 Tax=Callithrix jacchus TaxID=9483 RepID=A0A8I3X189_CALJA
IVMKSEDSQTFDWLTWALLFLRRSVLSSEDTKLRMSGKVTFIPKAFFFVSAQGRPHRYKQKTGGIPRLIVQDQINITKLYSKGLSLFFSNPAGCQCSWRKSSLETFVLFNANQAVAAAIILFTKGAAQILSNLMVKCSLSHSFSYPSISSKHFIPSDVTAIFRAGIFTDSFLSFKVLFEDTETVILFKLHYATAMYRADVYSIFLTRISSLLALHRSQTYQDKVTKEKYTFIFTLTHSIILLIQTIPLFKWNTSHIEEVCGDEFPSEQVGYLFFYILFVNWHLLFLKHMTLYAVWEAKAGGSRAIIQGTQKTATMIVTSKLSALKLIFPALTRMRFPNTEQHLFFLEILIIC